MNDKKMELNLSLVSFDSYHLLNLTLSKKCYQKYEDLKTLLAHRKLSTDEVFDQIFDAALEKMIEKKFEQLP